MRVAFYGNTANNFFAVARAVRRASDIDAHLFIDSNAAWGQLPEREDPELVHGYPDWIHKGPYHSMPSRFWPGISPLVKELEAFDVVMVSGGGVRLAPFVDRPFIFYVTGWDLTVAPFPIRFIGRSPGLVRKAAAMLGGFWHRRGLQAIDQLWSQPFSPFATAAKRLAIESGRIVSRYFPIMIDTARYQADPDARTSSDPLIRRLVDHHDFILFHPTRMMLNKARQYVETGQWKGNDTLFEGFARFVRDNPAARPVLATIEHAPSPDMTEAKRVVARLGLEKNVVWLRGRTSTASTGTPSSPSTPSPTRRRRARRRLVRQHRRRGVVDGNAGPLLCERRRHEAALPVAPDLVAEDTRRDRGMSRGSPSRSSCAPAARRARKWAVEFHSIATVGARYVAQIQQLAETFDAHR